MKFLLTLCIAVAGLIGFGFTEAKAAEAPAVAALPSVVHMAPVVVVETGRRHHYYRRYHHRRHYYRHHRRFYR